MAARAPHSSPATTTDPVLAAALRAPLVPLTDEERALLADAERRHTRWIVHEDFASAFGEP